MALQPGTEVYKPPWPCSYPSHKLLLTNEMRMKVISGISTQVFYKADAPLPPSLPLSTDWTDNSLAHDTEAGNLPAVVMN